MGIDLFASTLLLISAAFHALWNALAKRNHEPQVNLLGIMAAAIFWGTISIPFFGGLAFGGRVGIAWGLGAGLCEAGYMVTLALAFQRGSFGIAYIIMRGGAMIIVWVLSTLILNESLTLLRVAGVLCLLIGLIVINFEKNKFPLSFLLPSYLCGAFIAGYHICYDLSLASGISPVCLFALAMWIAVPIFFCVSGKSPLLTLKARFKTQPFWIMLGGLLCTSSFVIFLVGLRYSGAGYAISLRNTSIVFAQIFAVIMGERVTKRQWVGALIVTFGAGLVAF